MRIAAASSADTPFAVKIARKAQHPDVMLSVQHMLNCGNAGSCYGGSLDGPYQWIKKLSDQTGTGISYYTSQPYIACSHDSKSGLCVGHDWSCNALNVARTCPTFGEKCVGLSHYPNATVVDHGVIHGASAMQKEIFNRGPIACEIDAGPIEKYTSGIATQHSFMTASSRWSAGATMTRRVSTGSCAIGACALPYPHRHTRPHPHLPLSPTSRQQLGRILG